MQRPQQPPLEAVEEAAGLRLCRQAGLQQQLRLEPSLPQVLHHRCAVRRYEPEVEAFRVGSGETALGEELACGAGCGAV